MKFAIISILTIAIVLLLIYALWGREWLKTKPWAAPFFAWIEPIELALFKKSETILFARLKMLTGAFLSLLTVIGTIDITPLMPFIPEKWRPYVQPVMNLLPMLLSLVGWADEKLRNQTTKPIELVAVKEADAPIAVKIAIAEADQAKEQAVATVKAAS